MPADEAEQPGTIRRVRMTLDDVRNPGFGGRMWGYDREQVDRLLVAVADSVEKLQRRRQRDAAAMEALSRELADAKSRAAEAEQRLAGLEAELEAARRTAAEATTRMEAAERVGPSGAPPPVMVPPITVAAGASSSAEALAALDDFLADDPPGPGHAVPLALRAARALVREARARAAEIIADAEQRTDPPPRQPSS